LHYSSNRRTGPFVAVNCSAIRRRFWKVNYSDASRGLTTDARTQKKGLLGSGARRDFVPGRSGDLSSGVQAKFLRVLEQQSFRQAGGVQDIEVDLRVIAATNRDLSGPYRRGRSA